MHIIPFHAHQIVDVKKDEKTVLAKMWGPSTLLLLMVALIDVGTWEGYFAKSNIVKAY